MTRSSLQPALPAILLALASLASCASIDITRETQTSGRFESTGTAFTILSIDLPKPALNIARDNAADARLTNMQVTDIERTPDLGSWDWLLDILGVRYVRIVGTWGFTGQEPGNGAQGQ